MTLILTASVLALIATIPTIETVASILALVGINLDASFEDLSLMKDFLKGVLSIFAA